MSNDKKMETVSSFGAQARQALRSFWRDESGMGTVEVILIIVVLIGLVLIFKTQLQKLVKSVFEKITSDSNKVMS